MRTETGATHHYKSTACVHGLHDACRLYCKWCNNFCNCNCHNETKTETDNG